MCLFNILLRPKLLDTMFDSKVFMDGVNVKRKLKVMGHQSILIFFILMFDILVLLDEYFVS